jgi:small subunit ribosomal protein S17
MADTQTNTPAADRPILRTIQGVVASDKGDKTIKVVVSFQTRHAKYGKYRPLSKTKHHRLVRIVEKAPERAVQVSAEEVMTGKAPEKR